MATTKYTTASEGDYLRITASEDFTLIDGTEISDGDDGGLIASEDCLDNDLDNGTCWVLHDGLVKDSDARISDNAIIGNNVQIDNASTFSGNIKLYSMESDYKLIIKDNGNYGGYGYIVLISGSNDVSITGDDTDIVLYQDSFDDGKTKKDNGIFFYNAEEDATHNNFKTYGNTRIEFYYANIIDNSKISNSYISSSDIKNSDISTNRLYAYSFNDSNKEYNSGSYWLFNDSYSSFSTSNINDSLLDNVDLKLIYSDSMDTCAIKISHSVLNNITNKNLDTDEFDIDKPIYMYKFKSINDETIELSSGVFLNCKLINNSNNKFKSFVALESDYIENEININETTIEDSELENSVTGYDVSDSDIRVLYNIYSYRKAGMYFYKFRGVVNNCFLSTKTKIGRDIELNNCSVKEKAMVLDNVIVNGIDTTVSEITGYAKIKDEVILDGRFYIRDSATIKNLARINGNLEGYQIDIYDNTTIADHAYVEGKCYMQDNAFVGGSSVVIGDGTNFPTIRHNGTVLGKAQLHNKVYVYRNSIVDGNAILRDNAGVYVKKENGDGYINVTGNSFLSNGAYFVSPAYIDEVCRQNKTYFSEYLYEGILVTESDDYLRIGYTKKTWKEWKSMTREDFGILFNYGIDFYDRYWDYLKSKIPNLN